MYREVCAVQGCTGQVWRMTKIDKVWVEILSLIYLVWYSTSNYFNIFQSIVNAQLSYLLCCSRLLQFISFWPRDLDWNWSLNNRQLLGGISSPLWWRSYRTWEWFLAFLGYDLLQFFNACKSESHSYVIRCMQIEQCKFSAPSICSCTPAPVMFEPRMLVSTWLCFWGHDMLKSTHLQSNMRRLQGAMAWMIHGSHKFPYKMQSPNNKSTKWVGIKNVQYLMYEYVGCNLFL